MLNISEVMYGIVLLLIALGAHGATINEQWDLDLGATRRNFDSPAPPLPIVLWHGMGDACCSSTGGIGTLKIALEQTYGGE